MRNVLYILKRDILRLFKAPAALVVVAALLVFPSLYTWYNVVAFWNPYEETGNLKVAVVNQDAGTENDLAGEINVGERVAEEILKIDKLNFMIMEKDEAMADLEAGDLYAVYVFPENFSECLISPLTGTVKRPTIEYYANEKLGPVSPKITDTAAGTLEDTINSMFVQTVSDAAIQAIDDAISSAEGKVAGAQSVASARMNAAIGALSNVREDMSTAQAATADAKTKVDSAAAAMDNVSATINDARTVVDDVANEADAVQKQLMNVASDATSILPAAISKAAQVDAKVSEIADDLTSVAQTGQARIDSVTTKLESAADTLESLSTELKNIANALPGGSGRFTPGDFIFATAGQTTSGGSEAAASNLLAAEDSAEGSSAANRLLEIARQIDEKTNALRTLVNMARELDGQLTDLSQTASNTSNELKDAAKRVTDALQGYSDGLFGDSVQTIISMLNQVNAGCSRLTATLTGLDTTVKQAQSNMRQLANLMDDSGNALLQTDALIAGIQDDLRTLSSDIHLLADSGALAELLGSTNLDAESISAFLGSPTKVEKIEFYHPNVYGTAMAPLFMNLTFWIGAFMLIIIFRLEVDDEGIERVTLTQRYLSRFLLFAIIAALQAIICCIGVIALGVEVANIPALLLASVVSSLAFLSIIYALSSNLHHIGKALCIILVFAQIPGGSGLYPLELTDDFFQAIYPFLPFSYGIDALREAIFGFYGNYFQHDITVLVLTFFGMLVLGIVAVPLMSNVTRMAARQIREGDLFNGEEALVPARPYRLSQVVSALSDREDYREGLERRYARFSHLYPILIRASIVLGIVVPVVLMLCMALNAGEKVVLLTIVLLWLVGLVVFLLVVESLRYSFERQLNIERMSDSKLIRVFLDRNRMQPALARIGQDVAKPSEKASGAQGANGESRTSEGAHDA